MCEEGINSTDLLKDFIKVKKEKNEALDEIKRNKERYEGTKAKQADKLKEMKSYLKKMKDEVMNPLLKE